MSERGPAPAAVPSPSTPPRPPTYDRLAVALTVGAAVRLALQYAPAVAALRTAVQSSILTTTPLTRWSRIQEALFLYDRGLPLYDNALVHQPPILLPLLSVIPASLHPLLLTVVDTAVAAGLATLARRQRKLEPAAHAPVDVDEDRAEPEHKIQGGGVAWTPAAVALAYLLNPLSILSCIAMDAGVIERGAMMAAAVFASGGDSIWASGAITVAFQMGFYPVALAPILALIQRRATQLSAFGVIPAVIISILMWNIIFYTFYTNVMDLDGMTVFKATIGFVLTVPDLQPNLGIFWYLLTEVFDHFRGFFVMVFQLHPFVYLAPIIMRFGRETPIFCLTVYTGVLATLKAYPTVGDYALWLGLLPIYANTWKYFRYPFITANVAVYCAFLFPIMHALWTRFASGNANFFYALTLVLVLGATVLQADCLHAMHVRLHHAHAYAVDKLHAAEVEAQEKMDADQVVEGQTTAVEGAEGMRNRGSKGVEIKNEESVEKVPARRVEVHKLPTLIAYLEE
ncbi:hypothetical protein GGF32_007563 [Allomyces javanicus]|nr:hypothetical protein GGF32_007563 [Allomyces javanicus]